MSEFQGNAGQIKSQEVSSLATKKAENKTSPKKIKGGLKRQIAGRLVGAAALLSTMGIHGDNLNQNPNFSSINNSNPEATQSLSVQDLEKRAEGLYQIKIVSPEESLQVRGVDKDVELIEWSKENIAKITNSLDMLPAHFYSPAPELYRVELPSPMTKPDDWSDELWGLIQKSNYEEVLELFRKDLGKDFYISQEDYEKATQQEYFEKELGGNMPVSFFVVNLPKFENSVLGELQTAGTCNCDTRFPSNILLDNKILEKYGKEDALDLIAHELVHRVTRVEDYQFIANLLEIPSDTNFDDFLSANIEKLPKNIDSRIRFKLAYGTTNPNEFISVASEFYIHDREYFLKNYTPLIGSIKTEQLYDFMKNKIFKGQEYGKGQKLLNVSP